MSAGTCIAVGVGVGGGLVHTGPDEPELEGSQTEIQSNSAYTRRGANQNAQTKQVRNNSGGGGALANFLEKFAKSEEFVGVAHSTKHVDKTIKRKAREQRSS